MAAKITIRPAVPEDLDDMIAVFYSAFQDSALNRRSFPTDDPTSHEHHVEHFRTVLADPTSINLIAEDHTDVPAGQKPLVVGCARWVRRPSPGAQQKPRTVFTADKYPPSGDGEFAAEFFQRNTDATRRIVGVDNHWFLSIMLVRRGCQRRGVGSLLMRYGTDGADRDGWIAALNSSIDGRPLYEAHGFRVIETSEFDEPGVVTYHMRRDAKTVSKGE